MAILLFLIPFRLHQFADSHTELIHQKLSTGQSQAYVSYHGSMDRFGMAFDGNKLTLC